MSQENTNLEVLQEIEVTKGIDTWEYSVYRVLATEAPIMHIGRISVFYRAAEHFSVEALQTYKANVFRFQMALVDCMWFIMGCYLTPDNASPI